MLTREEKRAIEREEQKKNKRLARWLLKLNTEQRQLLTEYCIESSRSDIMAYEQAYDRVLRPLLQDVFDDEIEAEKFLDIIKNNVTKEGLAIRKFKNGSVEYMANIKKEKGNIIEIYSGLISNGISDKEAYEELKASYPMFTASALKNVIAEYKRDKKKAAAKKHQNEAEDEIELNPDMNIDEIAKAIVNCGGITENENKARTEEKEIKGRIIRKKEKESTEEAIDKQNEEIISGLVEVTQVREFVGKFGSYQKLQGGVVKAGNLEFSNANDIEECKKQIDEELEAERKEFEKKQAEKRVQSLGRLGEIMSLLSM